MNEQDFLGTLHLKAKELGLNPLLLLSGIEGLYTFKEVGLNKVNYEFLDSLILTIFTLRIGDEFQQYAEANLKTADPAILEATALELRILLPEEIEASGNYYLHSFYKILNGKAAIRGYHIKALEVAALEIRKAQISFSQNSIGTIILQVCKEHLAEAVNLETFFKS